MSNPREDYYAYQQGDIQFSACAYCKHKHEDEPTCDAFPDGIPDEILMMKDDHLTPMEGDHGIQFESSRSDMLPARLKKDIDHATS